MSKLDKNNFEEIAAQAIKYINELDSDKHSDLNSLVNEIEAFTKDGKRLIEETKVLRIGIVGQVKAGKSSFLNSLFFNGDDILPKAATPMTAGLVILQYADSNYFEVEYYSKADWKTFENQNKTYKDLLDNALKVNPTVNVTAAKESLNATYPALATANQFIEETSSSVLQKITSGTVDRIAFNNIKEIQGELHKYVGAGGEYTNVVKSIVLSLNDERLKDIQIVDTPGVNDPIVSREMKTREILRSCHGVFFLSSASRFFDSEDQRFLKNRIGDQGINSVVMLASKFDSALQDVGMDNDGNFSAAAEEVESKLKKQFYQQLDNINFNSNVQFDVTSGISYAIAEKDQNSLDSTEKNVLDQMQTFYRDYFSDYSSAQETFSQLSNLEVIREEYLEGEFKKNKELIIKERVDSFFSNAEDIIQRIAMLKKNIELEIEIVQESSTENITNLEKNIENFSNNISKIIKEGFDKLITNVLEQFNTQLDHNDKKLFIKGYFKDYIEQDFIDTSKRVEKSKSFFGKIHNLFSKENGVEKHSVLLTVPSIDEIANKSEESTEYYLKKCQSFDKNVKQENDKLKQIGGEIIGKLVGGIGVFDTKLLTSTLDKILDRQTSSIEKETLPEIQNLFFDLQTTAIAYANNFTTTYCNYFSAESNKPGISHSTIVRYKDQKFNELSNELDKQMRTTEIAIVDQVYKIMYIYKNTVIGHFVTVKEVFYNEFEIVAKGELKVLKAMQDKKIDILKNLESNKMIVNKIYNLYV